MKTIFILCFATFFLGACATLIEGGDTFSEVVPAATGGSAIYLYRPGKRGGTTVCMRVVVADRSKGCLDDGGFVRFELAPGSQNIVLRTNAIPPVELLKFTISTERDSINFYRFSTQPSKPKGALASEYFSYGYLKGYNVVEKVSQFQATKEMTGLSDFSKTR